VGLFEADFAEIENIFKDMETEGARTLQVEKSGEEILFERSLDMRFVGQGSETNIAAPMPPMKNSTAGPMLIRPLNSSTSRCGRPFPRNSWSFQRWSRAGSPLGT